MHKFLLKRIRVLLKGNILYCSRKLRNYQPRSCRFQNTFKKFLLVHRTCFNVMRKPLIKFLNIMLMRRNDARNRISDVRKWRGWTTGVITYYLHTDAAECDVRELVFVTMNQHIIIARCHLWTPTWNRHSNSGVYKAFS